MSVLIKGMEMPTNCWRCVLSQLHEKPREMLVCKITHEEVLRHKIDSNCPLAPVPPHGRLIDADALIKVFKTKAKNPLNQETTPYSWAFAYECLADVVGDMPTIIPAEEGET